MKRVMLEPARLRIARAGFDVERGTPEQLLFDSDLGVTGSVAMRGITYSNSANFSHVSGSAPGPQLYKCTIPFGRTFPNPPGCVFGQLFQSENRVNMDDNHGAYAVYFIGTTTETELQLFIYLTGSPGVIIGPDPQYAFSWLIFL